jgi:hypothetical protein
LIAAHDEGQVHAAARRRGGKAAVQRVTGQKGSRRRLIGVIRPQIANSASDENIKVFGTILERGHRVGRRFPRPQDADLATAPF